MQVQTLPRPLVIFGLSGLLPQAICLALVIQDGPERWVALAAACFYAALILSFLGGLWWMAAMLSGLRSGWYYAVAVLPSLLGLVALLPWCLGWAWPGPSLITLGFALLASPLVDRALAKQVQLPSGWLPLRVVMAGGLGIMTVMIGIA
ncbi:MAG: DUF3429 domain-containing protein [Pseudomonadota bacterium]|nr:DUF3429 domain-containing protein [Pseudomonadota bacterium]